MAHVFTAPSDRIMFFVNDTSSVGSFVNVKNEASEIDELRARDKSEINAEILSKVTSIEEDEEDCH